MGRECVPRLELPLSLGLEANAAVVGGSMEFRDVEGPTVHSPCDSTAQPMRSKFGMKSREPFGRLGRIAWPLTTPSYGSLSVFDPEYVPINHHATMHAS